MEANLHDNVPPFIPPDDSDEELPEVQAAGVLTANSVPPSPSPPRKRASAWDRDIEMTTSREQEVVRREGPPARDPDYYMSDGSCVLLVDNTFFNVHRTILSRDSSFFGDLFSVPQGESPKEGTSDDNPIRLHGESVSEFRNFLWVLYALPHQVIAASTDCGNLPRLIDIARVSNKYSFRSLETWALDSIVDVITPKPATSPYGVPSPSASNGTLAVQVNKDQTVTLVRLAQMCSHERLLNSMVRALRRQMCFSPQSAYLAMSLADELDLRELKGDAYFEVLLKHFSRVTVLREDGSASDGQKPQLGDVDEQGYLVISRAQQLRLLAGHYQLVTLWETMRSQPISFEHAHTCETSWQKSSCVQSWMEFWRDKTKGDNILALGPADIRERLKQISREFDRLGAPPQMHPDCKHVVRRAFNDKISQVESSLADYFSAG